MDKNTVKAAYKAWQEAYLMRQRAMMPDRFALKMRSNLVQGRMPEKNLTWMELLETFKNLQKRS